MTRDEAIEAGARALLESPLGGRDYDAAEEATRAFARADAEAVLDAIGWVEPVEGPSKLGGNS